jgi:hypothetical protein
VVGVEAGVVVDVVVVVAVFVEVDKTHILGLADFAEGVRRQHHQQWHRQASQGDPLAEILIRLSSAEAFDNLDTECLVSHTGNKRAWIRHI